MSSGWNNRKPAPLEYFHSRLMELFHDYRRQTNGDKSIQVIIDGNKFNNLIAHAKTDTYKEYPDEINSDAIMIDKNLFCKCPIVLREPDSGNILCLNCGGYIRGIKGITFKK